MGFEKDKLGRKPYADILTGIIDNPEKYKRNSDSDSFTMAIDSSWGTGKTQFLNMWKEELEKQKNEEGNNKYIVIHYNSWENDFANDPFQTIIYTILSNEVFNIQNDMENGKTALKEAFGTILELVEQGGIPGMKTIGTAIKGGEKIVKTMFQETCMEDKIQEFKNYKSNIQNIKTMLEKITQKTKIVMLIDELDRCKPLFAIKLLEAIKHIFNVKNMSFVFALDMTQLSHSVKKVYGSEIDAAGYICRLFDYITKMPNPDTKIYLQCLMEKRPLIRRELKLYKRNKNGQYLEEVFEETENIFLYFIRTYQLSLRDINTIYINFVALEERELKETNRAEAYALYLLLLILKYKNLELFNKMFVTHNFDISKEQTIQKIIKSGYLKIEVFVNISKNVKIKEMKVSNIESEFIIKGVDTKNKQYTYIKQAWGYRIKYNEETNLSGCLFYSDIDNFENIKEMTITDYIHEKLELFDFEWEQKQKEE